jgi:hypothetical protein
MNALGAWDRWSPVSGLVFATAFLALFFVFFGPGELPAGADASQIAAYYHGRGPAGFLFMYSLIGLSGAALVWFAGSLRASLRLMEPAPGILSDVACCGGLAVAALLVAGGAALLAPFAVTITTTQTIDPSVYHLFDTMGFLAINLGLFGQAVQVVATSVVALRSGGLPVWFAWVGFLVAVALVLNLLYFFGLFVWVGWVLLAGGVLWARRGQTAAAVRGATAEGIS